MKRLVHILVIMVLLVSTTGVTVDSHYCGSSYMGTTIMGMLPRHGDVPEMPCCMMNKHCKHCKTLSHSYKVQSPFVMEQSVQLHPMLAYDDLSDLIQLYANLFDNYQISNISKGDVVYKSPYHDFHFVSSGGFRAPPFPIVLVAEA